MILILSWVVSLTLTVLFLSAEILPKPYKTIRKDGFGGVFIGFKSSLQLPEITTLASSLRDVEIIKL